MNTQFKRNILWHTFLFFSAEETSVKLQRSCQLNSGSFRFTLGMKSIPQENIIQKC